MQEVEVRIEGHVDEGWIDWLGAFTIAYAERNVTVLTGSVQDQAALYGLIAKLRDLGVKLLSINYRGEHPGGDS